MNQTRKNVQSTKGKQVPFEIAEYPEMRGKKVQDIYISTYNIHETTFSDQTGQFPTRFKQGNKYIMIMVETRGSGAKNVIFSNGPNSTSECSKLLY
jgi:hypothetical protein